MMEDDFAGNTSTEGRLNIDISTVSGIIGTADVNDWFEFTAQEGQALSFALDFVELIDNGFVRMVIRDANGDKSRALLILMFLPFSMGSFK